MFTVPSGLWTMHYLGYTVALWWLHIQVADRVHLTVSTNKFHDVNHNATSEIALIGAFPT